MYTYIYILRKDFPFKNKFCLLSHYVLCGIQSTVCRHHSQFYNIIPVVHRFGFMNYSRTTEGSKYC